MDIRIVHLTKLFRCSLNLIGFHVQNQEHPTWNTSKLYKKTKTKRQRNKKARAAAVTMAVVVRTGGGGGGSGNTAAAVVDGVGGIGRLTMD